MQDQSSPSTVQSKSALQTPELIVTTRKEGSIALIVGLIYLVAFPLVLRGIASFVGLAEASTTMLMLIDTVCLIVVAAVLMFFLKDFFKCSWAAFRANPKGKFVLLILLTWVLIFIGNAIINSLVMPALGLNVQEGDTVNLQMSMSSASPVLMMLMAGILAPLVEETVFRGALFGRIHTKSHILAWVVSIGLFAIVHVWMFALLDPLQLLRALSWVPMGVGFAFVYRRSGNVFAPMTLHMLNNIIAVLAQILLMT